MLPLQVSFILKVRRSQSREHNSIDNYINDYALKNNTMTPSIFQTRSHLLIYSYC